MPVLQRTYIYCLSEDGSHIIAVLRGRDHFETHLFVVRSGPVCPCGLIGHSRHKRVIGGTPADIHAYPFAVSGMLEKPNEIQLNEIFFLR